MRSEIQFGTILKAAVLAGILAGLLAATFHFAVTEPVIDRAITLEEEMSHGGQPAEEPVVSRNAQRGGLFVGFVIYGLSWSLLFAVAFQLAQRKLPASTTARRGLLLALAAYWSVALLPFLKYPANPPGVGDAETIAYRQTLFVALLILALASTIGALALGGWVQRVVRSSWVPWATGIGVALVSGVLLLLGMPANPDPVRMPADLVASFRALSLAGTTLFWVILGVGFAFIAARSTREPSGGMA